MTVYELQRNVELLADEIASASSGARLDLQPKFSHALKRLAEAGSHVPAHMRDLDAALLDEAIEARFDNMPV